MRKKNILFVIALFLFFLTFKTSQVKANGVFVSYHHARALLYFLFLMILYAFIITIILESLIIIIFLRNYNFNKTYLFTNVLKINLFTFTLAQSLGLYLYFTRNVIYGENVVNYIFSYMLIELIPISVEIVFFIRFYFKSNKILIFYPPVKIKTIVLSTLTANILSILFGLYFSNIISW